MGAPRARAAESALVVGSFLTALAICEGGLRLLGVAPDNMKFMEHPRPYIHYRETDMIPTYGYRPGFSYQQVFNRCRGRECGPDKIVPVNINSRGLRDVERPLRKPAGVARVLVLGDSFTFGYGVSPEETYPKRLEARLRARARGPSVDVINTGVDGYSTYEEVAYLERDGFVYQPDLIIVGMYLNDSAPALSHQDERMRQSWREFNIRHNPGLITSNVKATVDYGDGLYLARWWSALRYGRRAQRLTLAWYRGLWDDENRKGVKQFYAALDRLAQLRRERGVPVLIMLFPKLHALDGDYPFGYIHERIAAACVKRGLPLVDLLPALRGRDAATLWQHPSDHHPNAATHELAASVLEDTLRSRLEFRLALGLPPGT